MVSKDHGVVFCRVHQSNDIRALAQRSQSTTLGRVTGVHQQCVVGFLGSCPDTGSLIRSDGAGTAADQRTVHIIGVKDRQGLRGVFL